jgi:hypothetical protein
MAHDGRRPIVPKEDFNGMIKKKAQLLLCKQHEGSTEDAFYFGLRPFDRPVYFCRRR